MSPAIANPAALGLGGFALTTFVLSTHNAGLAPDLTWVGLAFFYGGLAQLAAGMWEFRTGNTFGATAFSTYGAFWLSLASFIMLVLFGKVPPGDIDKDLGWFLLAFAILNTYMLVASAPVNMSVFLVFLTLEITEILLFVGFFNSGNKGTLHLAGYLGIITALLAWYGSAAVVVNSLRTKPSCPWVSRSGLKVASGSEVNDASEVAQGDLCALVMLSIMEVKMSNHGGKDE